MTGAEENTTDRTKALRADSGAQRRLGDVMRIIDISVPVTTGMFRFPRDDHVKVSVTEEGTYEKVNCRTSRIIMGSHSGTHIDAPMHMIPGGTPIEQVPLQDLVGRARVLRIRKAPREEIGADCVDPGVIDEPRVILDTGWYRHWGKEDYYEEFPKVTEGFAELLVKRKVKVVVVDLPLSSEVHDIILGSGGCQVENVIGLDQITADKVELIALPIRIIGIDAAPARVVVIEKDGPE